ncbi:MAG: hypothetical protein OSB69_10425 [Alphaproteobacteria bacterium]|nr:hypothetical protein [Alphaproteobacteria bacterium]
MGNRDLAVYDLGDGYAASQARCIHGGANLCDGISMANISNALCIRGFSTPESETPEPPRRAWRFG